MLAAVALFDLVCVGPGAETRYRIDLARGEYCAGECGDVRRISSVTDTTIMLVDDQKLHSDDPVRLEQVDRATGAWRREASDPPLYQPVVVEGICRPAAFTGFPPTAPRE